MKFLLTVLAAGLGISALKKALGRKVEEERRKTGYYAAENCSSRSAVRPAEKKRDTGKCDGDCDHCPSHYGYRYGRWYYGHGHMYSCQRGGNGGASGRTYRD